MVAPPGEVVDANHPERVRPGCCPPPDDAQERVAADRQHEALSQARPRPAAERQAEMVDNPLQPPRTPREGRQHVGREAFGEDLPPAQYGVAPEAPDNDLEFDASPAERQVGRAPQVTALNAARGSAAGRTGSRGSAQPHDHLDPVGTDVEALDDEARRHEARGPEALGHGTAPLRTTVPSTPLQRDRARAQKEPTQIAEMFA